MSTLKVLEQTFGKYVANDIHRYHVANLHKNVMDELNTKINELYQYNVICKKHDKILLKVLVATKYILQELNIPLPTDIPSDYNITFSDKDIHLKYSNTNINECYCTNCFYYFDRRCMSFSHYIFEDPPNNYLRSQISNIKSDMNTLKKYI